MQSSRSRQQHHLDYLTDHELYQKFERAINKHTLTVWRRRISLRGVKAIAQLIRDNKLRTLYLEINRSGEIGNEGLDFIARAINNSYSLTTAYLGYNSLSDAQTIAKLLTNLDCPLETLRIGGNLFDDDGAEKIAVAILKSKRLRCLDLSDNPGIGKAGEEILLRAFEKSTSLVSLFVNDVDRQKTNEYELVNEIDNKSEWC